MLSHVILIGMDAIISQQWSDVCVGSQDMRKVAESRPHKLLAESASKVSTLLFSSACTGRRRGGTQQDNLISIVSTVHWLFHCLKKNAAAAQKLDTQ